LSGSHVGNTVTEYWPRELGDSRDVERLDELQVTAIGWGNGIVDSQVETLNICSPEKTSAFLTVQRRSGTVTDTENVGVLLGSVGDKGELRITASRATELEDMSLVLDDIDVDVSTTEGHDACSGVYRVFILGDLNSSIELVWSHLIATKVVEIQPVGLAAFPGYHAHTSDIRTLEDVGG